MITNDMQTYLIIIAVIAYFVWRYLRFQKIKKILPSLLERGATVIDVRTINEFNSGSHPISINMPLTDLNRRIKDLDKNKPVIVCCASGARSGVAQRILKQNGFVEVINAGPWTNI